VAFSSTLREVSDDISKQLKSKEQNETTEYILLYGKFEAIIEKLGSPLDKLLHTSEFAFGRNDDGVNRSAYIQQWHDLYKQLVDAFLKSREPLAPLVLKNLRKLTANEPKSDTEFERFARSSVQYVFDICRNELKLVETFFGSGPILAQYSARNMQYSYMDTLEQNRLSHVKTLHSALAPYLSSGDLRRVVDLVNWVETMCLAPVDDEEESEFPNESDKSAAHVLLSDHLWPLSDTLFIKAASDLELFKPTPDNLKIEISNDTSHADESGKVNTGDDPKVQIGNATHADPAVSSAYPTVKTAVSLLIMYNDSKYDRPVSYSVMPLIIVRSLRF
jgi:conserved oligomeric Golgi complex subunit 3